MDSTSTIRNIGKLHQPKPTSQWTCRSLWSWLPNLSFGLRRWGDRGRFQCHYYLRIRDPTWSEGSRSLAFPTIYRPWLKRSHLPRSLCSVSCKHLSEHWECRHLAQGFRLAPQLNHLLNLQVHLPLQVLGCWRTNFRKHPRNLPYFHKSDFSYYGNCWDRKKSNINHNRSSLQQYCRKVHSSSINFHSFSKEGCRIHH